MGQGSLCGQFKTLIIQSHAHYTGTNFLSTKIYSSSHLLINQLSLDEAHSTHFLILS